MKSLSKNQRKKVMGEGIVLSLHIAQEANGPMRSVKEVRAVVGKGLEGDRYFKGIGTFSHKPGPSHLVAFHLTTS